MENTREIQTHIDGSTVELPIFDGEHVEPDSRLFQKLLGKALEQGDAGVELGEAFTRPIKAAQPIFVREVELNPAGTAHVAGMRRVQSHRYLLVEGADGQHYAGETFERGAWIGGRREPGPYKRIRVEVHAPDQSTNALFVVTTSPNGRENSEIIDFPQDHRGPSTKIRLFGDHLDASQVIHPKLTELLSAHFGRPVEMVRLDEMVIAGDPALPENVRTQVWANDGSPLHMLTEESIAFAEKAAVEQKGTEAAKLPHRPWRPDLVLRGAQEKLVHHLEDEIALWAVPTVGNRHVLIQTVRGTPRCAGMQGYYGVVNQYRPKEPRDRRDGLPAGKQRPLFGVNAMVFGQGTVQVGARLIPVAARPKFEDRWEGRWMR